MTRKSGWVNPPKRKRRYVLMKRLIKIPCFLLLKAKSGRQKQKAAVSTRNIQSTGIFSMPSESVLSGGVKNIITPTVRSDTIPPIKAKSDLFFLRMQTPLQSLFGSMRNKCFQYNAKYKIHVLMIPKSTLIRMIHSHELGEIL